MCWNAQRTGAKKDGLSPSAWRLCGVGTLMIAGPFLPEGVFLAERITLLRRGFSQLRCGGVSEYVWVLAGIVHVAPKIVAMHARFGFGGRIAIRPARCGKFRLRGEMAKMVQNGVKKMSVKCQFIVTIFITYLMLSK